MWVGFVVLGALIAGVTVALPNWKWATGADLVGRLSWANLRLVVPVATLLAVVGTAASFLLGRKPLRFLAGFPVILLLALVGFVVAGNAAVSGWGVEFVFWALALAGGSCSTCSGRCWSPR